MAALTFFFTDFYYRKLIVDQAEKQISLEIESFSSIVNLPGYLAKNETDLCSLLYQLKSLRLTLIDSKGKVLCDSLRVEDKMDNHLLRPEIKALKAHEISFYRRTSSTSANSSLYGAKLFEFDQRSYFIRAALSLEDFSQTVFSVWKLIVFILLPALLFLSLVLLRLLYRMDERQQIAHQKLKGDLVANISHEVRTPLTSIIGYLQLLESESSLMSAEQRDYLNRLKLSVKQLHSLFADVLELSLLENEMPLNIECLNSRDLIDQVVRQVEMVYLDKKLSIETDIEDFEFWADGKFIEMVFKNIVDNACKYSKLSGDIYLIFKRDGDLCRFICRDRGVGIPSDLEGRIFERFYRGAAVKESGIPGTGLGLSIAKHAVGRHQGKIWYASVQNQGTTFFVELPLQLHS